MNRTLVEFNPELHMHASTSSAIRTGSQAPSDAAFELEWGVQLLEAVTTRELDSFCRELLATSGSDMPQHLRAPLLHIFETTLGQALVPGGFGARASEHAPLASSAQLAPGVCGLEFEGLSREDQEFETAQALVRVWRATLRELARHPAVAPAAIIAAVRGAVAQHTPGLLNRILPLQRASSRAASRILL